MSNGLWKNRQHRIHGRAANSESRALCVPSEAKCQVTPSRQQTLQAGSDYWHVARASYWHWAGINLIWPIQGNPAHPDLESTSAWSSRQAGRLHPQPHSMTLARLQLPLYGMACHL